MERCGSPGGDTSDVTVTSVSTVVVVVDTESPPQPMITTTIAATITIPVNLPMRGRLLITVSIGQAGRGVSWTSSRLPSAWIAIAPILPGTSGAVGPTTCKWISHPLQRCRRRTCPGYARIWAGDQRRKLFGNLSAYADQLPSGLKLRHVLLSAVTAPGVEDGLGWDEDHCRALGEHRHSGLLGCRVEAAAACAWNKTAPARRRLMHGEAYRRCRREGLRPWLLTRVWEMQKRGVLHVHPVLAYSTAAERRAAERYLQLLGELRQEYGFGFVERKHLVREPKSAAAYLSSYFVAGKGRKASLQESVTSEAMPRSSFTFLPN